MRYRDLNEAEFDLSKVKVQFRSRNDRAAFRAVYDGQVICSGEVAKDAQGDGASVLDIVVVDAYRRKGVATKIYNAIEKHFGWKLHPSDEVRPDGQEFWNNRNLS